MSNINVLVTDQSLHITDAPKIAAQGVKENYVVFTFNSYWDGFGKSALFYRADDEDTVYESVIDQTGKALVPYEVTQKDGKICFGVCGVKDDIVYTSEIVKYKIVKGRYTSGEESEPPTPGIYEQMLVLAGSISDQLNNTPYIEYEEDGEYVLPVHTIDDSSNTSANTWSAQKISNEIASAFSNKLAIKTFTLSANVTISGENVGALNFECSDTNINTILAFRDISLRSTAFIPLDLFTVSDIYVVSGSNTIRVDVSNPNSASITFSSMSSYIKALVLTD